MLQLTQMCTCQDLWKERMNSSECNVYPVLDSMLIVTDNLQAQKSIWHLTIWRRLRGKGRLLSPPFSSIKMKSSKITYWFLKGYQNQLTMRSMFYTVDNYIHNLSGSQSHTCIKAHTKKIKQIKWRCYYTYSPVRQSLLPGPTVTDQRVTFHSHETNRAEPVDHC